MVQACVSGAGSDAYFEVFNIQKQTLPGLTRRECNNLKRQDCKFSIAACAKALCAGAHANAHAVDVARAILHSMAKLLPR